jgi:hypothetical protein
LLHLKWTQPADLLDDLAIYSEVLRFVENRVKRRGRYLMWDFTVIENRVDKQFYPWIEQYILPKITSVKAKKIAYIFSENFLPQLSGVYPKQLEFNNVSVPVHLFDSQTKASEWLLQQAQLRIKGPENKHHH